MISSDALADPGGAAGARPLSIQILSFLHTNFLQCRRVGPWRPPYEVSAPPSGNPGSATAVTDPGFPVGWGRGLSRQLHFENFVCWNERIWTLGGMPWACPPRSANDINGKAIILHYYKSRVSFCRRVEPKLIKVDFSQGGGWIVKFCTFLSWIRVKLVVSSLKFPFSGPFGGKMGTGVGTPPPPLTTGLKSKIASIDYLIRWLCPALLWLLFHRDQHIVIQVEETNSSRCCRWSCTGHLGV